MNYLVEINYETTNYNYENNINEENVIIIGFVEANDEVEALSLIVNKLSSKYSFKFNYSSYNVTPFSELIDINQL